MNKNINMAYGRLNPSSIGISDLDFNIEIKPLSIKKRFELFDYVKEQIVCETWEWYGCYYKFDKEFGFDIPVYST